MIFNCMYIAKTVQSQKKKFVSQIIRTLNAMEVIDLKKEKNKQYEAPKTHADLPQLSFVMCISGPRGTGKSLLIRNLLLRKDMLKKVFGKPNYIIIISPSLQNGDYDEIKMGGHVFKIEEYSHDIIDNLIGQQKAIIAKHGRKKTPEILLVLDDVLDSGALNFHSSVEKVFSRGRHVNINCILVSQHLNRISKTMRINSDYIAAFRPNNMTELENMYEQFIPKRYWWGMNEYLKNMWDNNRYQFLFVDFKTHDSNRRFREGFSKPIILDELPKKK